MKKDSRILVLGATGLVGSAIVWKLNGYGISGKCVGSVYDLRDENETENLFDVVKPEYVFNAAAVVGGIKANMENPVRFIDDNLRMQCNITANAYRYNAKLLFLGSSCIYPKYAPQPITEDSLLASALEPTNEFYAIAKIAGIKLCQAYAKQYGSNFISVMPTNLYGPGDHYRDENNHVIPALIRKFHDAKKSGASYVTLWGTGKALREFLYVDDVAEACIFLMENYNRSEIINIGSGEEISIGELAIMIKDVVGYEGEIRFDNSYPDGTPRKRLDSSRINSFGWKAITSLAEGLRLTYADFIKRYDH